MRIWRGIWFGVRVAAFGIYLIVDFFWEAAKEFSGWNETREMREDERRDQEVQAYRRR